MIFINLRWIFDLFISENRFKVNKSFYSEGLSSFSTFNLQSNNE